MAIVQPKSVKYRVWATHLVMWGFLALIIFPLIMVIAISFRNGNFSVGEIIPTNPTLDHWKLALGMSITNADGSITVTFEGTLQSASSVNGPWGNVDGVSPLVIQVGDMKGSEFFRTEKQ